MLTQILISAIWPAVLALTIFSARGYIGSWIKRKAEIGFEEKLEALRSELRKSETAFAAQLNTKQKQLDNLRDGALSGSANRRTALNARRLLAVERVWQGVTALSPLKYASTMMGTINFDAAAKAAPSHAGLQKMFATIGGSIDIQKLNTSSAANERPFLSETAWAYFSAYAAVVSFAFLQVKTLELGLDGSKFLKSESVDKLITAALPHTTDYVKQWGASGYHMLLDQLEERLLLELRNMLEGKDADASAIAAAANILKVSETLQAEAASGLATKTSGAA